MCCSVVKDVFSLSGLLVVDFEILDGFVTNISEVFTRTCGD